MDIVEFDRGIASGAMATRLSPGGAALEIDLLKTLVAITETGSFNRAAKAVFRTPSAVSMQMKRLEELIGRPIFAKEGRGVTLTGDGEELLVYAHRILALAEEALLKFRCATTEGTVRLGTPDDYAAGFLPPILARFAKTHPSVQVDVTCHSSDVLSRRLDEGDLDIALVSAGYSSMPQQIVHREPLAWVGRRDGVAFKKRPLPLAVSFPTCSWRRNAISALHSVGIEHRVAYSSYQFMGQVAAVLADLAVAPLAVSSITGDLVAIEERDLPSLGYFEIDMRRSPTAHGPAVEALSRHIQQNFATLDAMAAA
jgi:DNA-binding transcriptional LysR family regulator